MKEIINIIILKWKYIYFILTNYNFINNELNLFKFIFNNSNNNNDNINCDDSKSELMINIRF